MTSVDYLQGLLLLAVPVAAAAFAAVAVVRRLLGHLDRLEGVLAGFLLGLVAFLGVHLLPLVLGVLSQPSVLVASVLLAAGTAVALRRPAPARAPAGEPARPPGATGGVVSWAIAGTAAAGVVAGVAQEVRGTFGEAVTCLDTLSFHLPNVARWMESGSLWQNDRFLPLQAQGSYPNTGDVLLLGFLQPFSDDALVRWPMLLLLGLFALAVVAGARELGAPRSTGVAAAAALCSIPIMVRATVVCGMPDVVLLFGFAAGGVFALRHARTGRLSDLVLAGLGLGLAFGTKWYGVPAAVLLWAVAMGARTLVVRPRVRAAREAGLLAGVVAVVGGIWLLRNAVTTGNPVFPVALPGLDTPQDVVRDQVGFSLLHYVGDWDVADDLVRGIDAGLGLLWIVLLGTAVWAVVVGARGLRDRRLVACLVLAALLALAYAATPYTALGPEGQPGGTRFNTRYAAPALVAGVAVLLLLAARGRRSALVAEVLLGLVVVRALPKAFEEWGTTAVAGTVLLAAGGAVAALVVRRDRRVAAWVVRPAVVAGVGALALAGIAAYAWRTEEAQEQTRYRAADPVFTALDDADQRPGDLLVAIAGDWNIRGLSPVWPAFGRHVGNDVEVLGEDDDGFLRHHADARSFLAQLQEVEPDLLVVGRGNEPLPEFSPREAAWAERGGWRVVQESDRLMLLARSGS